MKRDPDKVFWLRKREEIVAVILHPNQYAKLCKAAGAPPCDSIWHVTTPREPSCTKCGVTE